MTYWLVSRGITKVTLPSSSGTVQSTLTVPATSVHNGTTVRCAIGVSLFSTPVTCNYSTLTVLPGENYLNSHNMCIWLLLLAQLILLRRCLPKQTVATCKCIGNMNSLLQCLSRERLQVIKVTNKLLRSYVLLKV